MKKLFLFLLLSGILISCSDDTTSKDANGVIINDSESAFQLKSADLSKLKSLYDAMITSSDYIALSQSKDDFFYKMNFDGDISDLKDETSTLNWIASNINNTGFIDYNEALNEYDNIKNAQEDVIVNHIQFFTELDAVGADGFLEIIEPSVPDTSNAGPCENTCINNAVICGKKVDADFAAAMGSSAASALHGNIPLAAIKAISASLQQKEGQENCAKVFKSCMCDCNPNLC